VWVKHENHTPTGAFKVAGGLKPARRARRGGELPQGVNQRDARQSTARASRSPARRQRIACTIVVPHGNSPAKKPADARMGCGAREHGRDFDEARVHAAALAAERGLRFWGRRAGARQAWPSYALELFRAAPPLTARLRADRLPGRASAA